MYRPITFSVNSRPQSRTNRYIFNKLAEKISNEEGESLYIQIQRWCISGYRYKFRLSDHLYHHIMSIVI